jgi:hypothetical protein
LSNDAFLKFNTISNTNYVFKFNVIVNSHTTPDFQFALNHTGTTTETRWTVVRGTFVGNYAMIGGLSYTTANGTAIPIDSTGGAATGDIPITIFGYISVGATAGHLDFQWAQSTSNANPTTVYKGSFLEYQIVT